MLTSNPNRVRIHSQKVVPGLETFSQVRNVSPDLSEVRVQRLTRAGSANANPNVVRVPSRSSW